jgi:hypothetical protein
MASPSAAELAYSVEKINRVPDRYRRYTESRDVASRLYRIDPDLLAQLLDLGLPSKGSGADLRLDPLDLRNLAISLRRKVSWFVVMRWWSAALELARTNTSRVYQLGVCSRCGDCAGGDCTVDAAPELVAAADAVEPAADAEVDFTATVRLEGSAAEFPPHIADILHLADPVEWHVVPSALATDVGFLRTTGLSDCRAIARYLCDEGRRRGLHTRISFGLLMTVPFANRHQWVEFKVDGAWLPADPLLLNSMARWGYLDPAVWPPTTSLSGAVWRISEDYVPMAWHGRVAVDSTLPNAIVSTDQNAS